MYLPFNYDKIINGEKTHLYCTMLHAQRKQKAVLYEHLLRELAAVEGRGEYCSRKNHLVVCLTVVGVHCGRVARPPGSERSSENV